jgi:hypothetical protein
MLRTINASCAIYTVIQGVSRPSQARLAMIRSTERVLVTWTENQVKRNSSADLMAVKTKA